MGGVIDAVFGGGEPKESKAVKEARLRQEQALKSQEAETLRQKQDASKKETELSGDLATQRRALAAQRRNRGGLQFGGPQATLKNTFGG